MARVVVSIVSLVGSFAQIFGSCEIISDNNCTSDGDCNLGGRCVSGSCACSREWSGPHCGRISLVPAELDSGFRRKHASSWGGKIIRDPDTAEGHYHIFAASFVNNCGLSSWRANSEIIHAIADKPTGPFVEVPDDAGTVVPSFSHNPTVESVTAKDANGTDLLVMMYIGCGHGSTVPLQCKNGTTPTYLSSSLKPAKSPITSPQKQCDNPHFVGVSTATNITGPWTVRLEGQSVTVLNPNGRPSWHDGTITNPSLWILADDSGVLLAYSTGCKNCNVSTGRKHVGIALGKNWSGPFLDLTPDLPIFPFAAEDPCIFVSPETKTYHILAHTDATGSAEQPLIWPHVSAHAYATNPQGPWTVSSVPPYSRNIKWADNTETTVETRERPQVIFFDGIPSLLVNGVKPGNATSPATPNGYTGDWSYTHVQKIG